MIIELTMIISSEKLGIEYLIDPDNYAGRMCDTPGRASQVRQVEG